MAGFSKIERKLAVIAGVGTSLTFLGHGMWAAAEKNPKFVDLLTGTFKNVFGTSMDKATAIDWIQLIGVADIVLAFMFAAATVGFLVKNGWLRRLASSRLMVVLYSWGVFWGFVTALSRVTAADTWYPEVWDFIERAPNFTIPLVGLVLVLQLRKQSQKR